MITNFRDLGGLKNKDSKVVKKHKFLRSGELSRLTKKQSEALKDQYYLAKVVDFRSQEETEERPDIFIPDTKYIHIDILENIKDEGASIEDFVKIGSPQRAHDYMKKLYSEISMDPIAQKGYRSFFDEILTLKEQGSLLFHCFAGKDRTGIGAALILEALDVPKKEIYTDFMITNQLRQQENQEILQEAKADGMTGEPLKALEVALNVDSSYLDAFYQSVAANYGSMSAYLKEALQLDQERRQVLQQRFLTE